MRELDSTRSRAAVLRVFESIVTRDIQLNYYWSPNTYQRFGLAFYNMNIDAIAMPCPICEEASKKMDELSADHVDLFREHLQKSHGMTA